GKRKRGRGEKKRGSEGFLVPPDLLFPPPNREGCDGEARRGWGLGWGERCCGMQCLSAHSDHGRTDFCMYPHKRGRFGWGLEGGRASQGLLVTLVLIHGDDSSTLAPQPTQDYICCNTSLRLQVLMGITCLIYISC
ncbi:unnamed protein product, partial [Musa hybrid cultivar]